MGRRPVLHRSASRAHAPAGSVDAHLRPGAGARFRKDYWVGEAEVDKLLRKGEGWLAKHPEREAITARYLRFDRRLTRDALARLAEEDAPDPEAEAATHLNEELNIEAPLRLWEQR